MFRSRCVFDKTHLLQPRRHFLSVKNELNVHLLVMTLPDREARKPTLTSTRVMRRPLLWRCSVTSMSSPAAPWTKSEEKRHQRNTQYHISAEPSDRTVSFTSHTHIHTLTNTQTFSFDTFWGSRTFESKSLSRTFSIRCILTKQSKVSS